MLLCEQEEELKELNALTSTQRAAVDYVVSHAERESNAAQGPLQERLTTLSYRFVFMHSSTIPLMQLLSSHSTPNPLTLHPTTTTTTTQQPVSETFGH